MENKFVVAMLALAGRFLTQRELSILKERYPLGSKPLSMADVAKNWNITPERLGEIEKNAFKKLQIFSRPPQNQEWAVDIVDDVLPKLQELRKKLRRGRRG